MPSTENHLSLAAHNIDVLIHLGSKSDFCDWMTITAFYSAIHLIEAMLCVENGAKCRTMHSHGHGLREQVLLEAYPAIYKKYRVLCSAAHVARYITKEGSDDQPFMCHYCFSVVREKLIKGRFAGVINTVKTVIAGRANLDSIEAKFTQLLKVLDKV